MKEAAVIGYLKAYRTLADGSLQLKIELDEPQSHAFHECFPQINIAVVVARLDDQSSRNSSGA